jgi:transposase-like protein
MIIENQALRYVFTQGLTLQETAPGTRTVAELEGDNKQLRKELAQMRMERDIVKTRLLGFPRSIE